jgi:hypothetical protein
LFARAVGSMNLLNIWSQYALTLEFRTLILHVMFRRCSLWFKTRNNFRFLTFVLRPVPVSPFFVLFGTLLDSQNSWEMLWTRCLVISSMSFFVSLRVSWGGLC